MINLDTSKPEFEKVITHLKGELGALRGNRATPALVEHVVVEAYGMKQPLKALAAIAVSRCWMIRAGSGPSGRS